jgi:hypothetical protein
MSPLSAIALPHQCWGPGWGWHCLHFSPLTHCLLLFRIGTVQCPCMSTNTQPRQQQDRYIAHTSRFHGLSHTTTKAPTRRRRRIIRAISHLDITSPASRVLVHEGSILERWIAWFDSVRSFQCPPEPPPHHECCRRMDAVPILPGRLRSLSCTEINEDTGRDGHGQM